MTSDRELVRRFTHGSTQSPTPITTNPLACALNLVLVEARAQPGRVVLNCDPLPLFVQGAGVLQGGALSSVADFAMAFAAMSALTDDETATTITLEIAFLRAAPPGRYEAIGEILRKGRTILFARAELRSQGHPELVATAASTLAITRSR
jgi:acyl-CoA thioesterase